MFDHQLQQAQGRGVGEELAAGFIKSAARTASDEEWRERGRAVSDTVRTLGAGEPAARGQCRLAITREGLYKKMVGTLRDFPLRIRQ